MLRGLNFNRNHSETVLVFAATEKENRLLANPFGVDKTGYHPV
jgi:hypothetical protein